MSSRASCLSRLSRHPVGFAPLLECREGRAVSNGSSVSTFAGNSQHTAIDQPAVQNLSTLKMSTLTTNEILPSYDWVPGYPPILAHNSSCAARFADALQAAKSRCFVFSSQASSLLCLPNLPGPGNGGINLSQ